LNGFAKGRFRDIRSSEEYRPKLGRLPRLRSRDPAIELAVQYQPDQILEPIGLSFPTHAIAADQPPNQNRCRIPKQSHLFAAPPGQHAALANADMCSSAQNADQILVEVSILQHNLSGWLA
jgi:hypothetical protein